MNTNAIIGELLADAGIPVESVQERSFPGERWIVVYVPESSLVAAQSMSGALEAALDGGDPTSEVAWTVTFRPVAQAELQVPANPQKGKLFAAGVDQLIQLLEARSRTSDALPSLRYVEDPRASLAAVGASRHQLVFGRRGVGKTALLLEAKQSAERLGHATAWFNAHVLRGADPERAFLVIASGMIHAVLRHGGSTQSPTFTRLRDMGERIQQSTMGGAQIDAAFVATLMPELNDALRSVLRSDLVRLYVYLDDFYLYPLSSQPALLDYVAGALRDCNGWIKVASIERLTRPFEPSTRVGLEVPHDASVIDIDVTLESPSDAQRFLEAVLSNYIQSVGLRSPSSIAKPEALGRLVLASGGVPRDYLNLFAASIIVARQARALAREVGKEDVAIAAGIASRGKKRDLGLDVASAEAAQILATLEGISSRVKGEKYTYFRVDLAQRATANYELLGQLVDMRFAHLVKAALSDQHRPGIRYDAYMLDLSEFADVRLGRGLNVLDLVSGQWAWRLTGQARTMLRLTDTQLRDRLRQAPVVDLNGLNGPPTLDLD